MEGHPEKISLSTTSEFGSAKDVFVKKS